MAPNCLPNGVREAIKAGSEGRDEPDRQVDAVGLLGVAGSTRADAKVTSGTARASRCTIRPTTAWLTRVSAGVSEEDEVGGLGGEGSYPRHDLCCESAGHGHRLGRKLRHVGPATAQAAKRGLEDGVTTRALTLPREVCVSHISVARGVANAGKPQSRDEGAPYRDSGSIDHQTAGRLKGVPEGAHR